MPIIRKSLQLSQADLKRALIYDPDSGAFTRIETGEEAGFVNELGYRTIKVGGVRYVAARLAWLYTTGAWPSEEMDHINGERSDDRFANLREASRKDNCRNRRFKKSRIAHGVRLDCGKYEARITFNGKQISLGRYDDRESAVAVRLSAERKYYGKFARRT